MEKDKMPPISAAINVALQSRLYRHDYESEKNKRTEIHMANMYEACRKVLGANNLKAKPHLHRMLLEAVPFGLAIYGHGWGADALTAVNHPVPAALRLVVPAGRRERAQS